MIKAGDPAGIALGFGDDDAFEDRIIGCDGRAVVPQHEYGVGEDERYPGIHTEHWTVWLAACM